VAVKSLWSPAAARSASMTTTNLGAVPEISVVVAVYNEEQAISVFLTEVVPIVEQITPRFEIVFVNDGSRDCTLEILRRTHAVEPRVKVVDLSRNFGKDLAMSAGLEFATGRAVIVMDVDLQDPPALIPELVAKWREGYDMVVASRSDRSSDTVLKRVSAHLFYRLLSRTSEVQIPENVGDFRLLDRRVVDALAQLPERIRFMKGIFAWLGFRQTTVEFCRPPRAAGTTKWRFWPLWNFALDGIVSFTTLPLKIWSYLGFGCALFSLSYMTFIILRTLIIGVDVPGYASLLSIILFFNGLTMIGLGIIGEYLSRIFIEVKARPLYLVNEAIGFEPQEETVALRSAGAAAKSVAASH
jgi:polyisoprenyl-phosphate glycosyltransferase